MTEDERLDRMAACLIEASLYAARLTEALAAVRHHSRAIRAERGLSPDLADLELELDRVLE